MGRKEAMYISTFATALGILAFVFVTNTTAVMLVSIWISFAGTLMYAIICERLSRVISPHTD
jgi:polyferredoxin